MLMDTLRSITENEYTGPLKAPVWRTGNQHSGIGNDVFVLNFIVISVQGISAVPKSMPVQV